jgi:hypothetical protein
VSQTAAQKRWYADNPDAVRFANRQHYSRKREFIDAFKSRPCMDCGGRFPVCAMDFDHRPDEDKRFEVATNWGRSRQDLAIEIAKCDVVCANCHRIRTADRRPERLKVMTMPVEVQRRDHEGW